MFWLLIRVLLFCFLFHSCTGANICYFKEGSMMNVTCDLANLHSSSVLWQITELNLTTTLYNCTLLSCKLLNGSNVLMIGSGIQATTRLDATNSFIVSSSVNGLVDAISPETSLRNLKCQTDNTSVDACGRINVYTDPKNVTCSLKEIISDFFVVECLVYPVRPIGIVEIPDLITKNVSTFSSSIMEDEYIYPNAPNTTYVYYTFNQTKMGAGHHQFSLTVSANVSDPNKTSVTSNLIDISFWDDIAYVVCLEPAADTKNFDKSVYIVKCLTPLPIGRVTCMLNQKTNGTLVRALMSDKQVKYFPNQNILSTFALECQFRLFLMNFHPGHHQFQGNMSKLTSDGKVAFKTSNWTNPWILRYQTQMNFTVNGSPLGAIVKLNDSLSFHCSTDAISKPRMRLQQENYYFYRLLNDGTYFNGTDLSFSVTSCQQAGFYYCSSYGDLSGDHMTNNVVVKILCAQRLRSGNFQTGNEQYVGVFDNTNTVEIPVIGYPSPKSMILSKQQEPTRAFVADGVFITYKEDSISPYGNILVLFTDEGIISKMTNFTLRVYNGIGDETLFEFSIRADSSGTLVEGQHGGILILCIIYLLSMT